MSLGEFKRLYLENKGFAYCVTYEMYGELGIEFPLAKYRKAFLDCVNQCMALEHDREFFQILGDCKDFDFYDEKGVYGMRWIWRDVARNANDAWRHFCWMTSME